MRKIVFATIFGLLAFTTLLGVNLAENEVSRTNSTRVVTAAKRTDSVRPPAAVGHPTFIKILGIKTI